MTQKPTIPFFLALIVIAAAVAILAVKKKSDRKKWHRGDFQQAICELELKEPLEAESTNSELEFGKMLFAVGEFEKARIVLEPLLNRKKPPAEAVFISAHIEYMHGRYARAIELWQKIPKDAAPETKLYSQLGLLFSRYQTNEYEKVAHLFNEIKGTVKLPLWELMKSFGNTVPYQVEWNGGEPAVIHFKISEPLPVLEVEINGKRINAFIDTGAELFYLDEALAASLGIDAKAKAEEVYAGGRTTEVGYGKAETLRIGNITLKSVPVKLGQVRKIKLDEKVAVDGILSTGILQQFLPTLDYPGGRLILRPRNEASRQRLRKELDGKLFREIKFILAATHLMISRGSIHGKEVNFFVDSGLADSDAAVALPKKTLDYLEIPVPSMEQIRTDEDGGLAGGGFPVGRFSIENFGLGDLMKEKSTGLYGVFPESLYMEFGFIIDGIISHQYLKQYRWTIDFSSQTMILEF